MSRLAILAKKGNQACTEVCVIIADTFLQRAIGLLFTKKLEDKNALLIKPCSDVHTLFMRFNIDILFLSKDYQVLDIKENVRPFRFVLGPKHTFAVLEMAGGAAKSARLNTGDWLSFDLRKI